MDALRYITTFVRVAELENFSATGRQLGIAKSAVSKQINSLEEKLGTQLITRSTRKIALTEAGQTYYRFCKEIVELQQSAESELKDYQSKPRGSVRVASDLTFGRIFLAPLVSALNRQYADLKIELLLEDRIINIIEENIDLSVRVGWLQDSSLIARKLFDARFVVFASPGYIEQHGQPLTPQALHDHKWVNLNLLPSPLTWKFTNNQQTQTVQLNSKITTNSVDALISLVKNDSGISALAEYIIKEDMQTGQLMPILENYTLQKVGVYAVYPNKKDMPVKTKLILDRLLEKFEHY